MEDPCALWAMVITEVLNSLGETDRGIYGCRAKINRRQVSFPFGGMAFAEQRADSESVQYDTLLHMDSCMEPPQDVELFQPSP